MQRKTINRKKAFKLLRELNTFKIIVDEIDGITDYRLYLDKIDELSTNCNIVKLLIPENHKNHLDTDCLFTRTDVYCKSLGMYINAIFCFDFRSKILDTSYSYSYVYMNKKTSTIAETMKKFGLDEKKRK